MKVTVIGGGSTYTPELADGFARLQGDLPIDELWLVDPDPMRLELVSGISRRMFAREGHPGTIHTTDNVADGVRDADVVLFQLRIGGQAARHSDETFPHEEHVIGQETTGPGGFAKALRTVPVVLEVAETVRRLAKPDAWIIDFTNPVGIVTRALLEQGHRAVGLCNVAIGYQRTFAEMLGVHHDAVSLGHVGLNHLTWELDVTVTKDGSSTDVLPELLRARLPELAERSSMPSSLLELQGAVPSSYLQYYYRHDEMLQHQQSGGPTRAQSVMEVERALLEKYADPTIDVKPIELTQRGGAYYSEAAVDLMRSLVRNRGDVQVVNVRNDGALPFLPDDHVIEVPAEIHSDGLVVRELPDLSDEMVGLIGHVAEYERLALEAAVHGGRERVVRAMLAHPLVGQISKAERLADLLIATNRDHLAWASR